MTADRGLTRTGALWALALVALTVVLVAGDLVILASASGATRPASAWVCGTIEPHIAPAR